MNTRVLAKKAVQDQIVRTALRLFKDNGFENTTVEQISSDMEMSSRTFFRYFRSKDEVLLGPVAEFSVDFLKIFNRNLSQQDLWSALEIAISEAILNFEKSDPEYLGVEMQLIIRNTPILFAKQLEIIERLQIEATDLYCSKSSNINMLNWTTANAIIRAGIACFYAIQSGSKTPLDGKFILSELKILMIDLKPSILSNR